MLAVRRDPRADLPRTLAIVLCLGEDNVAFSHAVGRRPIDSALLFGRGVPCGGRDHQDSVVRIELTERYGLTSMGYGDCSQR